MKQLDLFDASGRTTAEIFRFPVARRTRLIYRTAATIEARKTPEARQGYWSRTVANIAAELRRHGADQAEVDRQLDEFHSAVSAQLARHQAPATGPRGAA